MSVAGPAMAVTYTAVPAMSPANVALHPDDGEVALAAAPVTQHLTAPTLFGLLAGVARPRAAGPASGGVHPRHHGPVAREPDPRKSRAPPAITDR
ncbi:MAG: hypothetical protein ACRDS1_05500 [Pseudonocardiaceae bacterium]